ncbi:ABC transporter substrate-binding protein [Fertoebacter nigrum]|uniref:ABC transporter substrate-binding protein n=1 Tax=Fertoeibacter niger TaxID=2656921 RepID=A0A8X8H121_9RHOB|nr:ABC transporter substrate-binding protein [Fertoeibacter niger]NUB45598.1 ABC transporter substrate-binding protein [Fertoeibacter niger]
MRRVILSTLAALSLSTAAFAEVTGNLVLYTSQPNEDAQKTVDAFMAANPGVTVEWVRDGTPKIMAKFRAELEAGAPQADVLLIADSVTMEGLKAEGLLMAHPDADISAYEPGIMDADKSWFATKLITTGIVYNTSAPMQPTSYADLTAPEVTAAFMMPSPLASGAATIHMVAVTGVADLGWGFYETLANQGAVADGANGGVLKAVAGGEKLYGFLVDFLAIREAANGAPIQFVFPVEGVSAVSEPVAILANTQNPDAAKAFVDFLISEPGQQLAADMGYLPAHPGVTPPAGFPARDTIKILPFDPAKALAEETANKARFTEMFGG